MNTKDSGIGIDPTNIPVIESLDVTPIVDKKGNQKKPDKDSVLKKVVFAICIIFLMLGIAFGVYYYLHLGEENKKNANFKLLDFEQIEGVSLPSNISDYGDFSKVDINKCNLDLSNVDISTPGSYDYSVTCGKNQPKKGRITILKFVNFKLSTKIVYTKLKDTLDPKEFFVDINPEYKYEFFDKENYKNYLISTGIHNVPIKVSNGEDEQIVYGILIVNDETIYKVMNCHNNNINDIYYFNMNNYKINSIRMVDSSYDTVDLLESELKTSTDGKLTINNQTGIILYDYENVKISLVDKLSNKKLMEEYQKELSSDIESIRNIYENELNYSCDEEYF